MRFEEDRRRDARRCTRRCNYSCFLSELAAAFRWMMTWGRDGWRTLFARFRGLRTQQEGKMGWRKRDCCTMWTVPCMVIEVYWLCYEVISGSHCEKGWEGPPRKARGRELTGRREATGKASKANLFQRLRALTLQFAGVIDVTGRALQVRSSLIRSWLS